MRRLWALAPLLFLWGCGGKNLEVQVPGGTGADPDRVLFEQALKDLKKGRYTVARLTLNTLISTYPDSEFMPEAKYAMAESFYREGTTSNLNQAETEFKDFITFFPMNDRADDAQLMIAMTHVRQREKADRDPTQAFLAQSELNRMIETYPDSPLLDEAKSLLREMQEILAEGAFKIGNHYLIRRAYAAAVSRYHEVLDKYPDYSGTPDVLFNLAEALREADNPESTIYYTKIVTDYPFSTRVAAAKEQLSAMNKPIPDPNPAALARGKPTKEEKGMVGKFFSTFGRRPGISTETTASSVIPKDEKQKEEKAPKDDKTNKDDKSKDSKSKDNKDNTANRGLMIDAAKKPR
jgi:outer membrane protein assembly factor BamD